MFLFDLKKKLENFLGYIGQKNLDHLSSIVLSPNRFLFAGKGWLHHGLAEEVGGLSKAKASGGGGRSHLVLCNLAVWVWTNLIYFMLFHFEISFRGKYLVF